MTKRTCLVCGTPTTSWCAGCKSASYCGAEHQKKDWRSHKEYCQKVKAAGANTFDAIIFPVNETKPRLVKIPWKLNRGDEEFHDLDTDIWFKHTFSAVRPLYFHRLGINGPKLGRGLCLMYDDNFSMNRSPLNRCVAEATGGRAGHPWCGNILALRMESPGTHNFHANVNMKEDLKPIVTYFEEYNKVAPVY